jgi:hypothetical protein
MRLSKESFDRGDHIPQKWETSFVEGGDCLPEGWYLSGIDKRGMTITHPMRHEYGPFEDQSEAVQYIEVVLEALTFL